MAIHRISDFDPDYRNHFDDKDVKGMDLYVGNDKVGSVDDILVDDQGQIRYLIVHTGTWILGKKVLLPIGFARIDYNDGRVHANNLTKAQVENLPEFTEDMAVDYDHEERVRGVYRGGMQTTMPQDVTTGMMGVVDRPAAVTGNDMTAPTLGLDQGYVDYDRDTYSYDKEPNMYALNEQNNPNLKLYEERLIAGKTRQKTGEAVISKRVETETANASVEVDKERVVVNRVPGQGQTVAPGEASFQAGEVSRVEVYEEVPEFHKEAFVREEVEVSKVVDHETATAQEQLRREEIDVKVEDRSTVEHRN
jgi:uncharacterized protein (TIGR02271 family)